MSVKTTRRGRNNLAHFLSPFLSAPRASCSLPVMAFGSGLRNISDWSELFLGEVEVLVQAVRASCF